MSFHGQITQQMPRTEDLSPLENFLEMSDIPEAELLPHITLDEFTQLCFTSKQTLGLFNKPQLLHVWADKLMPFLANIIVNEPTDNNIEKLKSIAMRYPKVLELKVEQVKTRNGLIIRDATLLQLGMIFHDCYLCCNILEPLFKAVYDEEAARQKMSNQIAEYEGRITQEETLKELSRRFWGSFNALLLFILRERFDLGIDEKGKLKLHPETLAAIETWQNEYTALYPTDINPSHVVFSISALHAVMKHYEQYVQFWTPNFINLFNDAVLPVVIKFIPVSFVMQFCGGGFYKQAFHFPQPFRRTLIMDDGQNFYDALTTTSSKFSLLNSNYVNILTASRRPDQGVIWESAMGVAFFVYPHLYRAAHGVSKSLESEERIRLEDVSGKLRCDFLATITAENHQALENLRKRYASPALDDSQPASDKRPARCTVS